MKFNTDNQHQSQNTKQFHRPPQMPFTLTSIATPSRTLIPSNQPILSLSWFFLRMSPKWNECVETGFLYSALTEWTHQFMCSHLHCLNANSHILPQRASSPSQQQKNRAHTMYFFSGTAGKEGRVTDLAGCCGNPS